MLSIAYVMYAIIFIKSAKNFLTFPNVHAIIP